MPVNQDFIDWTEVPSSVIARRGMTCLDNVRGMTLRAIRGPVWVTHTDPPNIVIAQRGVTCLNDVRGMTLRVIRGLVWVTQSGSTSIDVSLDAGKSFRVTCNGRTLVSASHHAPFALVTLEPPVAARPTLGERLRRIFASMNATPSRPTAASR